MPSGIVHNTGTLTVGKVDTDGKADGLKDILGNVDSLGDGKNDGDLEVLLAKIVGGAVLPSRNEGL